LRNISCIHAALADSEKTAAFHVNHFDFTSSLFPRYHSGRRYCTALLGYLGLPGRVRLFRI
jgi:hypothetical protein